MTINIKRPYEDQELGTRKRGEELEDEGPEVEGHIFMSPAERGRPGNPEMRKDSER